MAQGGIIPWRRVGRRVDWSWQSRSRRVHAFFQLGNLSDETTDLAQRGGLWHASAAWITTLSLDARL